MAQTLAESFLADLEELSDDDEQARSEDENGMDEDELDKVRHSVQYRLLTGYLSSKQQHCSTWHVFESDT